ncbi:hypothetical protein Dsin_014289 [Dipteronia sinensis]|uniref:RNase H type-1 domain-containing protein n=1 Tax=Dipteronia sinensis TaxID=43782 RepID=A0AAE0AMU3_9ROSI|nr:hypothetical protein Dsin_014289 [Dipteronia sinensis]
MFIAIVWTIWESRNKLVFEGVEQEVSQSADMVKYRTVWWFKHLGKGSKESVDALLRNMKDLCVDNKKAKRSKITDWIPPSVNNLKFNVDGSSKGKLGPSGREITVVSDSKVAINWLNKGEFGNVNHVKTIYDIRGMLSSAGDMQVAYDSRIYNSFTDSLAKMGSTRMGDFVEWGDV